MPKHKHTKNSITDKAEWPLKTLETEDVEHTEGQVVRGLFWKLGENMHFSESQNNGEQDQELLWKCRHAENDWIEI